MSNKYFENALSNFVFDMAGGSAICHMADKGYSVKYIKENLKYPLPFEKIQKTVWEHLIEQKILLLDEPAAKIPKDKVVYIEKHGKYGRTSFCAVTVPNKDYKDITWHEIFYNKDNMRPFTSYITDKCNINGDNAAYVSCDFGIWKSQDLHKFQMAMDILDNRKREYIEGMPWIMHRVYHKLDYNMCEILCILYENGLYNGCCYFIGLEEKIIF